MATLNELDVAGLLKPDTQVKDLGLVISMYIYWSHDLEAYGIDADKAVDWRKDVIGYAKEAGIDLAAAGLFGTEKRLASLEEKYGEMPATKGDGKADRWGWKKAVSRARYTAANQRLTKLYS